MKFVVKEKVNSEILYVGMTEEQVKSPSGLFKNLVEEVHSLNFFNGREKEVYVVKGSGDNKRIAFVGLGKKEKLKLEKAKIGLDIALKKSKALKLKEISVDVSSFRVVENDTSRLVSEIVQLLIGSNYEFDLYKSQDKDNPKVTIETVYLVSDEHVKSLQTIADRAKIVGENVNFARNLVNENADTATSLLLAKVGREIADKYKLSCKILDERDMKKMGMGLLLAVSRGAEHPPRMIVLEYKGDPKSKDVTCIVGKGITFDTGGLNLKPTNYIEDMKGDMSAAAVCLATIKSAAQLGLKINLTAVVPTCENAIGPKSYHPGDVFKAYNGKTVQIENTDAEGRLILGDALSYVAKHIKPTRLVDMATLTGAVLVAFGEYVIGMVSNDDKMSNQMFEAGQNTYERVWRIPLYDEYKDQIKGDFADIKNSGYMNGRYAGTITAAAFLSEFVECKQWVHLDIAGVSFLDNPINYLPRGGTGVGVRLLLDFLEK